MTDPPAPERPLRIAMISYYLPSSSKMGIGYQVHSLATELARRGHTVDVFSECPPVPGALYGHRHVQLKGAGRTFRFALALRKIDFSSYDVLHAHGDDYWLWRRRVGRHVRTLHGSCFEEARRIRGFKEKARMVLLGLSEVLATLVADVTVMVSRRRSDGIRGYVRLCRTVWILGGSRPIRPSVRHNPRCCSSVPGAAENEVPNSPSNSNASCCLSSRTPSCGW